MKTGIFEQEINAIREISVVVAAITVELLENLTGEMFWTEPASKTGVHHPKTSNGVGGNIVHTKSAFWIAHTILKTHKTMFNETKASILSAVLLHDLDKFNASLEEHGHIAAERIKSFDSLLCQQNGKIVYGIATMVSFHMGEWGKYRIENCSFYQSLIECCKIVHLADLISSRPYIEFNEREITI